MSSKRKVNWHKIPIYCSKILHNQVEVLLGDHYGRITKWDIRKPKECVLSLTLDNNKKEEITSISVANHSNFGYLTSSRGLCYKLDNVTTSKSDSKQINTIVSSSKECHESYILNSCLNESDDLLATCSADNSVKVWAEGMDMKHNLTQHFSWVKSCCFSVDSEYLATGCSDGSARLWSLHTNSIVRQVGNTKVPINSVLLYDR